jgi:hypothetical protein
MPWFGPVVLGDSPNFYQTDVSHGTPTFAMFVENGARATTVLCWLDIPILVSHVADSLALGLCMQGSIGRQIGGDYNLAFHRVMRSELV